MTNVRSIAAAALAAVLASACYRVTVVTGAAPSAKVVDKPWNHSFVVGLVPPQPVDVSKDCGAAGVAQVVTQRSFLNGLVGAITQNIYTPLQITATCAAGAGSSSLGAPAPAVAAAPPTSPAPAAPNAPSGKR